MKKVLQTRIGRKILTLVIPLLLAQATYAQNDIVSGSVTDESGGVLPGVTVINKGSLAGTVTDIDGKYRIEVGVNATLTFSFVGYLTKDVPVGSRSVVDVAMEPDLVSLDEVVVTALGLTREKESLGYAVQELEGNELNPSNDPNIVNSLSGKIAGVQVTSGGSTVGASSRIVIRGNASFGDNQPLFVVDGTPIDNTTTNLAGAGGVDWGNTASDLDVNNIESVSVLKGATAAALYGSRATNGVILITTKRGNQNGNKIGVDVSSSVIVDDPSYFPAFQNEYGGGWNGSEYIYDQYQANNPGSNLSYNEYAKQFSYNYVDGLGGGVSDSGPINWGPRLDAGLLLDQWSTGPNSPWVSRPGNIDDYFRTGVNLENNVAISASGEKAYGRVSFTNLDTKGIIENTDQRQNTINASFTLTPSDRITANANVSYLKKESDNIPNNGYSGAIVNYAWRQRDFDTNYARQIFEEQGNEGYMFPNQDNPFYSLRNTTSFFRDRTFGNASIDYKINDWLSILGRGGIDFYNEYRKDITQAGTSRNMRRGMGGQFNQTQIYSKETNLDLILSFDKRFGDFEFDALVGANYRNNVNKSMFMRANDLTVPDLHTITNAKGNPSVSMYDGEWETNSLFFSANGSYKDYLYLGVTGRNDWSSTLPSDKWSYFYPSVSLGFVLTEALQLQSNLLSYAKLRGSWARVGGDTDPYQLDRTYSAGTFNSVATFRPTSTLPPTNLLPEETESYEIGAELRFFNSRVNLDVTYYNQLTANQILEVATSRTTGYGAMLLNAGEIQNSGVELMLNAEAINTPSGFSWDVTVNWAKNRSVVNELFGDLESYRISRGFGGATLLGIPGQEWGILWGLPFVRDDNGSVVVNNNGIPLTTNEGTNLGNVTPDFTGGLRNSFRFNGFNLSALLDVRKGGDFFSTSAWHSYPTGTYEVTTRNNVRETGLIVDGVNEGGSPNDIRVSAQDYFGGSWMWNNHEYSILDGSFVKLREVVLGYSFNVNNINWLQRLNLSFVGRNLAIIYQDESTRELGLDPEVGLGGGNFGVGFENFQIPTSRSYGFKLSASF